MSAQRPAGVPGGPRVEAYVDADGERGFMFDCPACGVGHSLRVDGGREDAPRWTFSGDEIRPTFSPSVLVRNLRRDGTERGRCHSYVQEGRIRFLNDCTHALAGQTVDLPEVDAE